MQRDVPKVADVATLFTTGQQQTLQAAVDRIIPGDDFPGAWEAGVGDYLYRQLAGDLRSYLRIYREGLDALDAEAQAASATPFAALTAEQQDLLLKRADFAVATLRNPPMLQHFFRLLVVHTAEGYYSDPGNGGNRGGIAWKMIGFAESDREADYA